MKAKNRILAGITGVLFLMNAISYSQELETVGAGVIDFLLTNPKTANQTSASEAAALNVIGNLLSISAHRKHEMNVAEAGRSEIIINTTSGSQATMYSDTQENVYLLYNGKIYPISAGLINQAKSETAGAAIKNSTLPGYNLSKLKKEYKFEKINKLEKYFLSRKNETLAEIAKEHNISIDDIYFQRVTITNREVMAYGPLISKTDANYKLQKLYNGKSLTRIKHGKAEGYCMTPIPFPGCYAIFLHINRYKHEIVTTFTCNWAKDFDGQGLDFDDFHGIKRSFYEGEDILFVLGWTTNEVSDNNIWELEIYESLTGKLVNKKDGDLVKGGKLVKIKEWGFHPGVYIYHFTLFAVGEKNISKTEKFEILPLEEK